MTCCILNDLSWGESEENLSAASQNPLEKISPEHLNSPVHYTQGHPVRLVASHTPEETGEPQGRR